LDKISNAQSKEISEKVEKSAKECLLPHIDSKLLEEIKALEEKQKEEIVSITQQQQKAMEELKTDISYSIEKDITAYINKKTEEIKRRAKDEITLVEQKRQVVKDKLLVMASSSN